MAGKKIKPNQARKPRNWIIKQIIIEKMGNCKPMRRDRKPLEKWKNEEWKNEEW